MTGDDLGSGTPASGTPASGALASGAPASGGVRSAGGPVAPTEAEVDQHALIAAHVAVFTDRPRADVLLPFRLSEAEWDAQVDAFNRRIVDEVRARAGSTIPIEQRYPLSARYAKSYAVAVRDLREQEAQRDLQEQDDPDFHADEDSTLRIPPTSSRDEPFSVLTASNRAATSPSSSRK